MMEASPEAVRQLGDSSFHVSIEKPGAVGVANRSRRDWLMLTVSNKISTLLYPRLFPTR